MNGRVTENGVYSPFLYKGESDFKNQTELPLTFLLSVINNF
jgi:hypothetical protein